jgi:organic hydroperoxide reductase OsmC/OhrA
MTDINTTTVSEEGFSSDSQVGDFELTIDATNQEGPDPNQVLVANYASCFLPAFRVAADQHGYEDLGQVEIETEATLDDDDDVESISFTIYVEEQIDDGDVDEIVDQAEEVCHVHSALESSLHADVTVESGAF